jgi:hypothetical protein
MTNSTGLVLLIEGGQYPRLSRSVYSHFRILPAQSRKIIMKNIKFISLKTMFSDYLVNEKLISLNNSFELLALFRRLG